MEIEEETEVAVDIDDVLFECFPEVIQWHNSIFRTYHRVKDLTSYSLGKLWGVPEEVAIARCRVFYHSPEHREMKLTEGARELCHELQKLSSLVTLTSRPEKVQGITLELFDRNRLPKFSRHHFLGFGESKVDVAKKKGFALAFEDAPHHAEAMAREGTPVLMPNRPWNRHVQETPRLTRVYSLYEAVGLAEKIIKNHRRRSSK